MGRKIYILGVDPGSSGALALLAPASNVLAKIWDFPLMEQFGHKVIDYNVLSTQIADFKDQIQFAVVENVHSMPLQGVASTFSFGVSKGIILGMLAAHAIPIYTPPPAIWKMNLGLSKDKEASRDKATHLYPNYSQHWQLKKHDGRAEAVLLAEFGKRFWKNEPKTDGRTPR